MSVRVDHPDSRHYRLCAGVMLFDRAGRIWVGRRIDTPGAWQMPQGGIGEGEEPLTAARRELHEEIGCDNVELLGEVRDWLKYEVPPAIAATAWNGKYRGQMQKWFAFRFLGADADIDVHGVEHPEFNAWRWVEIDQVAGLIVDFKRPVYEAVVAEFRRFSGPPAGDSAAAH